MKKARQSFPMAMKLENLAHSRISHGAFSVTYPSVEEDERQDGVSQSLDSEAVQEWP